MIVVSPVVQIIDNRGSLWIVQRVVAYKKVFRDPSYGEANAEMDVSRAHRTARRPACL